MKTGLIFVMLPGDLAIPRVSMPELLRWLGTLAEQIPSAMIARDALVADGATNVPARAINYMDLHAELQNVPERTVDAGHTAPAPDDVVSRFARLTPRQRQIMEMVLAGHPSKNIAADLGISQRTVENHRAAIMKRTRAKSLPELVRLSLAAT